MPLDHETVAALSLPLQPFVSATGLDYTKSCDSCHGSWHNFFVGVVGGVASEDHEVLWPNRVRSLQTLPTPSARPQLWAVDIGFQV